MDDNMESARQTLLAKIESLGKNTTSVSTVLKLAEAWAWLVDPSQPHGTPSSS